MILIKLFFGLAVLSVVFLLLMLLTAQAEGCPCGGFRAWNGWEHVTRCYRCRAPRVYGWRGDNDDEPWTACKDLRRVVGDQHLTVDGAKKAADDAWAGAVRFHLGEKWMDLKNARRVTYTCSRSSIKDGSVATLGQTLTRCEISAQPCEAPRQQEQDPR